MMHKCTMVKIGGSTKRKLRSKKKRKLIAHRGVYKFGANRGIYKFCENRRDRNGSEYTECVMSDSAEYSILSGLDQNTKRWKVL